MMEKGVGVIPDTLTPDIVNNLYDLGTNYLKTRVSYVFSNDKFHHNDWVIATRTKYLNHSMIALLKGSQEDKDDLLVATYLNQP